jgi:hypothetical protein
MLLRSRTLLDPLPVRVADQPVRDAGLRATGHDARRPNGSGEDEFMLNLATG